MKLIEIHQSHVEQFFKCQMKFMFQFLMKLPQPKASALEFGTAVDDGVTFMLDYKIKSGKLPPIEAVLDVFSKSYDKCMEGVEDIRLVESKDQGIEMMKVYYNEAAPNINPVAVQESFLFETDKGYNIAGTIDVVEKGVIRDTKTAANKGRYPQGVVEESNQAAMYSFAYEQTYGTKPEFHFDVLTKSKAKPPRTPKPKYHPVSGKVTDEHVNVLFQKIDYMNQVIESGDFTQAPDEDYLCNETWCPFWSRCKGAKK